MLKPGGLLLSFSTRDPHDENAGRNGLHVLEELLLPPLLAGPDPLIRWKVEIHTEDLDGGAEERSKVHLYAFKVRSALTPPSNDTNTRPLPSACARVATSNRCLSPVLALRSPCAEMCPEADAVCHAEWRRLRPGRCRHRVGRVLRMMIICLRREPRCPATFLRGPCPCCFDLGLETGI